MKNYAYVVAALFGFSALGPVHAEMNGNQPEVPAAKSPVAGSTAMNNDGVPKLEVEFKPAEAVIPASYSMGLDAFGTYLKNNPGSKAVITAYADHTGHGPANVALAQKRADTVTKYLSDHYGITADRISSQGAGEVTDKVHNDTAAAQQYNRRAIGTIVVAKS